MAQHTPPGLRLESSAHTKCSLFDQPSLLITKLAGPMRKFNSRAAKKAQTLILPSVGSQRKENRWATPNETGALALQESPEVKQQ